MCAACGTATRESRTRLPFDAAPVGVQKLLPPGVLRAPQIVADPSLAFFSRPDPIAGAHELSELRRWFATTGLTAQGRVLDVGGGPGFAAAGLAEAAGVTLLEYSERAVAHARGLGVSAFHFDFAGTPLDSVAPGPFDLVLIRYALAWCATLPPLAHALRRITVPGGALLLSFVVPTRGACLVSALEDAAPSTLWDPGFVVRTFEAAGWAHAQTFEPAPPLPLRTLRSRRFSLLSLPWALRPGVLPRDLQQRHVGLVLRATP